MNIGDLVVNISTTTGMIGLIYDIYDDNTKGAAFIAVIREDGICVAWYARCAEVINEVD